MAESLGARLRQQRERCLIPLTSIANQTKIGLSLLEGLERDDVSHWPMGIFRRSFLRSYAQAIGLEPDAVVRDFLQVYPDPLDATAADRPVAGRESASDRPPTRLRCLLASAFGSAPAVHPEIVPTAGSPTAVHPEMVPTAGSPAAVHPEMVPTVESRVPSQPELDLSGAASLCTELGRAVEMRDVAPLLESVARILDAIGLIVWVWNPRTTALEPALAHGYSGDALAKLPRVRRDTDNATAASFRSGQTRIVNSSDLASGAVVVPLLTPSMCVGVFAVELQHGGEQKESVRALATIFAAQLAAFVGSVSLAEAVNA